MKNLIAIAFSLVCFQFVVDAQSIDDGGLPNATIRIFNIKGQMIYIGKTLHDGKITISVNDFSPGMYNAQLIDSNSRNASIKFEVLR